MTFNDYCLENLHANKTEAELREEYNNKVAAGEIERENMKAEDRIKQGETAEKWMERTGYNLSTNYLRPADRCQAVSIAVGLLATRQPSYQNGPTWPALWQARCR